MTPPDGNEVLAWSLALGNVWRLDLAGGPPVLTELELDGGASWQRLAP